MVGSCEYTIPEINIPVKNRQIDFTDSLSNIYQKKLIPWLPLPMMDKDLIDAAKEIGLEKFLPKIKEIYKTNFKKKRISRNQTLSLCQAAIKTRKKIMVTVGTKNIHDILDSLNH